MKALEKLLGRVKKLMASRMTQDHLDLMANQATDAFQEDASHVQATTAEVLAMVGEIQELRAEASGWVRVACEKCGVKAKLPADAAVQATCPQRDTVHGGGTYYLREVQW